MVRSVGPAGRGRLGLSKAKEKAFGFSASFTQSIPSTKLTFFLSNPTLGEGPTPSLPWTYLEVILSEEDSLLPVHTIETEK